MSVKYKAVVSIRFTVDVDVPDREIAKGPDAAAAYARAYGLGVWNDPTERTTYADYESEVVHVTAFPVIKGITP